MNQGSPSSLVRVGAVIRSHGLGGLLRIWIYAGSETSIQDSDRVLLKPISGEIREHKIISLRPQKSAFLMKLEGVDSRNQAEAYREAAILIPREALRREEDEFFWNELLGLEVFLDSGDYLGKISQIIPTGAHDIYVVREGDREFLVPAVHEVVREIDTTKGKMTIKPLEGLLDLNEV